MSSRKEIARKRIAVGKMIKMHKKGCTIKAISKEMNVNEDEVEKYVNVYENNKDEIEGRINKRKGS